MTKQEVLAEAEKMNVKYVRLCFTDIHGTIKNVEIPVNGLKDALDNKTIFDGSSIDGFARIDEADMVLYPDTRTWLLLPWENSQYGNVARIICDVFHPDGRPFEGDPRYVLKRNLKKMNAMGFHRFKIGVEPEFFLFNRTDEGQVTLDFNDHGGYFDLAPVDGAEDCRRDIMLELQKLNFCMEASHHEVSPSQHEINFEFSDALEACDQLQTFKLVVRNVAKRHGLHATFMPKPLANINGSGMHTNCSLMDKAGNNVFYDENEPYQLSKVSRQFISGLLNHARSFTAITNPIVNSYKRLLPGYEAPIYVSWSESNRTAMIRVPSTRGRGTRAEVRSVDPAANPYLAISVLLRSGLDGIENDVEPAGPVAENLYTLSREKREERGIQNLPENLKDAMKELSASTLMQETLGRHVYEKFMIAKAQEWDEYRAVISKWELDRYLKTM